MPSGGELCFATQFRLGASNRNIDALRGEELQRLEVAESVRLAVDEAVQQHVDATQVEVVAQARASDRQLAFVGRAEARANDHAGREVEDVLQIRGTRLLDLALRNDVDAAGHALQLVARLFFGLPSL